MGDIEKKSFSDLIEATVRRSILSPESSLVLQQPKIAQDVRRTLERSYSVKGTGRVLLVTLMPDDSGSVQDDREKRDSVIQGHNELLHAMAAGENRKHIMFQTRYLNGRVLNPFSPLSVCQPLSIDNYRYGGGTPLFEQTLVMLGAVIVKSEELSARGATVRTASLIMTDGQPTESRYKSEVAQMIRDMRQAGNHIIAGMGFGADKRETNIFHETFTEMAIEAQYVFTATSRDEILRAFDAFRQSAIAELTTGQRAVRVHEL